MRLVFEMTGLSCDLALHPISEQTKKVIDEKGRGIYAEKYMNWWRKGITRSFGMRICDGCLAEVYLDDEAVHFDENLLYRDVVALRRRMYLETKAKFLAVFGYDSETCTTKWIWNNVKEFKPEKFQFQVVRWDRVLSRQNFLVVNDVLYDGAYADEDAWEDPSGFALIDPIVISLDAVRAEIAREQAEEAKKEAVVKKAQAEKKATGKAPAPKPAAAENKAPAVKKKGR